MTLAPGTRLGPYQVLASLGAGAMGEVYRAHDTNLDRDVALKVLPESLAADADALARFRREATAIAALSHPNILAIYDFGADHGVAYASMELLEGETLRSKLDQGPLRLDSVLDYGSQIANGLAAAHDKGIIHRDLKPENLFVSDAGHLKILDFGLAKRLDVVPAAGETNAPTVSGGTTPGRVMGTVDYMSPEQLKGLPIDHRTDIFSFGAVLYEMLTGKKPFRRPTAVETMTAILQDEPPAAAGTGREIPPELDAIVRRCLAKSRVERFQSARDIAFELQRQSRLQGEAADRPPNVPGGAMEGKGFHMRGSPPGGTYRRWERVALIILALFVLLLLGVMLFGWLQNFVVFGTFRFAVNRFVDATGISPDLAKGVLVVALVPFFLALRTLGKIPLFSRFKGLPKSVAWAIVIGYLSAYFLLMYAGKRDRYFYEQREGGKLRAMKFVVVRPTGEIVFSDTGGIDGVSGVEKRPVSPEFMAIYLKRQAGVIPKPLVLDSVVNVTFFDPLTREPKVWYMRSASGELELFSTGGFSPTTGEELKPVTASVVAELMQRHDQAQAQKAAEQRHAAEATKTAAAEVQKAAADVQEQVFRGRYMNPVAGKAGGQKAVAIVTLGGNETSQPLEDLLFESLREAGLEPAAGLFRPDFVRDGTAARLFSGDWALAQRLHLADAVRAAVAIREARTVAATEGLADGLRTATMTIDLKCVDVVNLKPCGARTIVVKGAGFSNADALQGAIRNASLEIQAFAKSLRL